jgi:enterobactin synthetase component D / holo-[acyl-carrier protein] synthase
VLGTILPREVATAEVLRHEGPAGNSLFPEEEAVIAGATAKRRAEFAAGRSCARAALARLGVRPGPIVPGERRAPRWPPGVVGAITHCPGYCAAAVAWAGDIAALGVDAEPDQPLPRGVLAMVTADREHGERRMLAGLAATPGPSWDRLLFSAKESVYKAWYPVMGRWLGFEDAELAIDPGGTFTARLLAGPLLVRGSPVPEVRGRWLAARGLILTAATVPP